MGQREAVFAPRRQAVVLLHVLDAAQYERERRAQFVRDVGEETQFEVGHVLLDARFAADADDRTGNAPGDGRRRQRQQDVKGFSPPGEPGGGKHFDPDRDPLVGGIGIADERLDVELVVADRHVGVGRAVGRPRDVPVLVVAFELVHVPHHVLDGEIERCELHAEIREIVGQYDAVGLGHRLRERRAAPRDDGDVAHVEPRETQVVVDLRGTDLVRIETVELASAAEEHVAAGRGECRGLAENRIAHVVVEVVVRENPAPGVEPRHGVVRRNPQVALPVLGQGHADIAGQSRRFVVAAETRRTVGVVTLDEVQSPAEGRQPDASPGVLQHVDDIVVAQRLRVARYLLHQPEAHQLGADARVEDQQSVDRRGEHPVRAVVEQPPHTPRLVERIVRHQVAGMDETVSRGVLQQVDAPAVGRHPDTARTVLLDAVDLVVAQRPGVRVGMGEMRDPVTAALGRHAVKPLALGPDPDVARRVLLQGVDHPRAAAALRRKRVDGFVRGVEGDQVAVARADPHPSPAVGHQGADFTRKRVRGFRVEGEDLGRLAQQHRLAQSAFVVGREPQHVVAHVETHDGVGHLAVGLLGVVVERLDRVAFAVVIAEAPVVHLDPQQAAPLGDLGDRVEVVGDGVRLLLEVLVIVGRGVVTRDARLGRGHPYDASGVGREAADAARAHPFGIELREAVARDAVEFARTAPGVDRAPHRISDDGCQRSRAARQAVDFAVLLPDADHLARRGAVDGCGVGRKGEGRSRRLAERACGALPGGDVIQLPVRRGDPGAAPVVEVHRRNVAAQHRGVEKGVHTHGSGIGPVGEARHAQPRDGHPRAAVAIVQAVRHAVMLRIDAVDERHHVLELFGIAVQTVDVEVIGREPEMAVRILAHRDEAVMRKRREVARRGAEILEGIPVETADPVPRADPHEAARIGVDVGDAVVCHPVQGGVGLKKALRGRRPGEPRNGGEQQKGQQQSFHSHLTNPISKVVKRTDYSKIELHAVEQNGPANKAYRYDTKYTKIGFPIYFSKAASTCRTSFSVSCRDHPTRLRAAAPGPSE